MSLLSFEHGRAAYRADFLLYGAAVACLSVLLVATGPSGHGAALAGMLLAGLLGWSLVEYGLHRFVLHALPPFRRWHEQHHQRPAALICTPTLLSGSLIGLFVFLPAALLGDRWLACALTLGLLVGYLAYAMTHHAIHHWQGGGAWLMRRKRWHALHHQRAGGPRCFGVTSAFWDQVFASAARRGHVRQRTDAATRKTYKGSGTETLHSSERTTP
jgi:sterol desaturase/sphingolipid hydroxylase (fatty acid hydroxylase superfamily)